jgi:hypothetical protein
MQKAHHMRKPIFKLALATATVATAAAVAIVPSLAHATVIYTPLATALTTPSNSGGGAFDGTGVWFNPLTGYAETRGFLFPDTLFEDGKFFLLRDVSFASLEALIYTQGYFSRGNGVIYASTTNLNPAHFAAGVAIGPGTGYQNPGAGYADLGPSFGNWAAGDRGFLGFTIRDASGASASDVFYAYADITVNTDFSVTLNAFAYENVRGAPITTSFTSAVPEPGSWALMGAGLAAVLGLARRRA